MLLFIGGKNKAFRFVPRFQYISCYCLSSLATGRKHLKDISIHLMLLLITGVVPEGEEVTKFQYISCYCLSESVVPWLTLKLISIHLMLLFIVEKMILKDALNEFQYISCYCLSVHGQLTGIVFPYFNTSHVTVYRRPDVTYLLAVINFNTSHVTVYLNPDIDDRKINIFQYISCYCLSYTFEWLQCRTLDFNTSHVTVYLLVARLAE